MLLPHLLEKPSVKLRHVATNRSLSSLDAKRRFGFEEASTDADAVLEDETVDAVFVVTRHHSHAETDLRALRAGKAVFVEKPLALSEGELQRSWTPSRDRERPAHGGLQPSLLPDVQRHAVPIRGSRGRRRWPAMP